MFHIRIFNYRNYLIQFDLILCEPFHLLSNLGCDIKGGAKNPVKIVYSYSSYFITKQREDETAYYISSIMYSCYREH